MDQYNFVGKILIAMPDMGDPRFDRAVIYICDHSADGAMGLILNKPRRKMRFFKLIKDLGIEVTGVVREAKVHYGGPVETRRGFVLHTDDYAADEGTMAVADGICMTATVDVLQAIAQGTGPKTSMLALGYAGWSEGQLESEIAQNAWLTCAPTSDILFGSDDDTKWAAAMAELGVNPSQLSPFSGRA